MDRFLKEKVSVILPCYNRAGTLARAIDSVLQQSYTNTELIIVDDGSTDHSESIVSGYQDQRISYYHRRHAGVSAARNFGIKQAGTSLIALIDSDDQWLPDKLSTQLDYLTNSEYQLIQSEEIWIRQGRRVNPGKIHLKHQGDLFESSLQRCTITPSSVLARKTVLTDCGLFDEKLPACEDYDLWLRITNNYRIGLIRKKLLIRHAGHPDQLSEKYPAMDRFRIYALHKLLASEQCDQSRQAQAASLLRSKASILLQGKHKRQSQHQELISLLQQLASGHWQQTSLHTSEKLLLNHLYWQ